MEHATENVNFSDMFAYCERTVDWVYIRSAEAHTNENNIQNKNLTFLWPSENGMHASK